LFEQFRENLSLTKETAKTAREGLRSAWRNATPNKRIVWVVVPTVIVICAAAEHFSVPWYYEAATLLFVALALGSWMRAVTRRNLQ